MINANKDYFNKDLEKNVYLQDKNFLINLNILNFVINPKLKFRDFTETFKNILKSKTHKFTIDGEYLMENGMQQGSSIGIVLREIEGEWIKNNFQISKERVREIIRSHSS